MAMHRLIVYSASVASLGTWEKRTDMNPEALAILGAGLALLSFGWRVYTSLKREIDNL